MNSYPSNHQNNQAKGILSRLQYPCRFHKGELCLNYCIDDPCFKPLCSQCIEQHVQIHKENDQSDLHIKTFKGVRVESLMKVTKLIEDLYGRMSNVTPLQNPEEMFQQMLTNIDKIKRTLHDSIQKQFMLVQQQIKGRMSHSISVIKSVEETHGNLLRIIQQLKQHQQILVQGRFDPNYRFNYAKMQTSISSDVGLISKDVSQSVEKIIRLKDLQILEIFDSEVLSYEDKVRKVKFGLSCDFDYFKKSIHDSLKIFDFVDQQRSIKSFQSKNNHLQSLQKNSKIPQKLKRDASSSSIIAKPLIPNYSSNYQVLHFFEAGENKLHIIGFHKQKPVHKEVDFHEYIIPSYHSSLLTEEGYIFLTGGSVQIETTMKSRKVARFSLSTNKIQKNFANVIPRSSHSLCEDGQFIYILGGLGQQIDGETTFVTDFERVNIDTGKVDVLPQSNYGGGNISFVLRKNIVKICYEGIEFFNFKNNQWSLFPASNYTNFYFNSACGFVKLNQSQVLIFGGYIEKDDKQLAAKSCSLWTFNLPEKTFKINNLSNRKLPIGEGFWNNQAISDGKNIYILQNVEDQENNMEQSVGCLNNERNLLKFDGQQWQVIDVKWNHL